ncbi:PREDICTED: cytochrome P450 6k1-like, partial [Nicrophorus vespilloides]|uniref:Cytochrome P450 6k1-like n=1 Tax=Nicrophorus vespilloides TaxID=110193 RepID=A0ABM1MGC5_NICVS
MAIVGSIYIDILIFATTFLVVAYHYFTWNFDFWKKRNIPYVEPHLFFGNFQEVALQQTTIGHFLADLYNKMKTDYFGVWVFGTPHLIVRSPEVIKNILVKDFNYFSDRTITSDTDADPIASKTLFFSKNPFWKTLRSKLSPIFTSGKIKTMIPLMNDAAADLKEYLQKRTSQTVDMKEVCAKFTTDVVTSCAFGLQGQCFQHEESPFRDVGRKMFNYNMINAFRATSYFFAPGLVKFLKFTFFDPSIYTFCTKTFLETIKMREKSGIKRNDLIDMIIEMKKLDSIQGTKLDDDVIVGQPMQFFAAGFETTSSTISFTLYEMCLNQELQLKLRREINKALDEYNGFTYEALKHMELLDKCIKETLRKYPVLPFLDRRCVKDYKMPNSDLFIEKGTPIYIPMFGLHYDPVYFPNPDKYDPERFSSENTNSRPQYAYIPFGEGPHNCIGERFGLIGSKLGIAHILSNFYVEANEETPVPIIYDSKSFVLQSTVGLPMKVVPYNRRMSAAA